MKTLKLIYILLLIIGATTVKAQTVEAVIKNIERGIKSGNASILNAYLDKRVEAAILNKEGDFGKEQVYFMLKEFFTKYPPAYFAILHRGKAGDTHYIIGTYSSTMGSFDVNIFIAPKKSGYKIEQLRFEKTD